MKYVLSFILLFVLTTAVIDILFIRSGTEILTKTLGPAFRSNAAALLQANASGSITTPIGASLQGSLPRGNFSNLVVKSSKINPIKQENAEYNETQQVTKIFHQNLDQYLTSVKKLKNTLKNTKKNTLNQTEDKQQIQQAVTACRNAFKIVNFLVDYFDAENTRYYLNGAPLPKLENNVPEVIVLAPEGLQVLDELVFTEEDLNLSDIKSLSEKLYIQSKKMVSYQKALSIEHRHVFEALRQEVIRIFTLYLTGFDTPGSVNGIPESAFSLSSCFQTITVYKNLIQTKAPEHWTNLSNLYTDAIAYLIKNIQKNNDFDTFDHLHFYKTFLQPIYQKVYEVQIHLGIETIDEVSNIAQPINYKTTQLFEADFFNAGYYSQINQQEQSKERAGLGKLLFFDPRLSVSQKMSCATCHKPEMAFTDGEAVNAINSSHGSINRNVPTVINSVLADRYFYDLRAEKLSQQIEHVVVNNAEFHTNFIQISKRLKQIPEYAKLFNDEYPEIGISQHSITNAISNYLIELTTFNSPFDQYIRDEKNEIDEAVKTGFNLFMGKAACATCHFPPSFGGLVPPFYVESETEVLGVTVEPNQAKLDPDLGRFTNGLIKEKAAHFRHSFKTTTVRNVELTAPYLHNGAYQTLEEVVDFYNHGGGNGMGLQLPNQTLTADSLHLTTTEKQALIQFMEALTDTSRLTHKPGVLPGGLLLKNH